MREKKSPEARSPLGEAGLPDPPLGEVSLASAEQGEAGPSADKQIAPVSEAPAAGNQMTEGKAPIRLPSSVFRRLSLLQKMLIVVVSLSAAFLSYSLVSSQKKSTAREQLTTDMEHATVEDANRPPASPRGEPEQQPAETSLAQAEPPLVPALRSSASEAGSRVEPFSLKLAEDYYAAKDYVRAYSAYEQLNKNLKGQDFELIKDFLQLRMALCLEKKNYSDKANQMFKAVSESRSVALRVIANYHIALLEMNAGQYLKARTRAYKTIALTGAIPSCEWSFALERDCTFLAAEAVTRQVLSLCDADKELPRKFLSRQEQKDILMGLNETELAVVLNAGIERLNSGLLAPQVRPMESISPGAPGTPNRWLVVCNGPGIEELMARFAANAALDVKWKQSRQTDEADNSRGFNFAVTLYLPAATAQQVASTAAGAVGLLAQIDDTATITITNPAEYSDLSQHTRKLVENAMWLWRTLLLTYSDDPRIPDVHFALGVLQESRDRPGEAITEYKLVANRYSQTALAPFALLHSSRLKATLRDYSGASQDLKQLIEQYPDNELVGEAYLNLAQNTMKAGLYDEACSLYRKAYNLGFSTESQTEASFGAGSCFYQMNDYESAVKWLTRYLAQLTSNSGLVAGGSSDPSQRLTGAGKSRATSEEYTAYLLLGKANLALGNLQAACDALNRTVRSATAADDYVEAVSSLVEARIRQENFVAALGTIENVRAWPFSQEQVTRLLLLKSRVLRAMGLTDQAETILTDKAQYLTDSRLKADIMLELANCYITAGNLGLARAHLIEVLSLIEPGPVAQQAQLTLADVCLKLGDHQRTISICTQLLETSANEQIKQQASKILASAYSRQQDYDKAALALLTAFK